MATPRPSPAPSSAPSRRARGPKPQSRPPRLFTTNSTSSSRPRLDSLTPGPTAPQRPLTHTCPNPACTAPNNVVQEDDGSYICHHCGTIAAEHSHIVSEIQFGETASGAAAVQGQYIGADQTHARSGTGGRRGGAVSGDGMNSKQLTELNARREMLALLVNLRLKSVAVAQSFIDPAIGLFKLALQHNFVQGRSIGMVAAVALYLQCRRNKGTNEVMLIDIAECINVNVFVLGKMYTKLIQKLYGTANQDAFRDKIDTINPENLIRRFAKGLEFPDSQARKRVVDDAIRLVQRMDRDWMATGRRPAGICGAALVLAARMNNFRRTVREVVLVVKVTEITINKRLEEFSYTDSSNLTVAQFRDITLERDCDPPAYYKARQEKKPKRRRKRKVAPETAAEIEDDEEEDEENGQEVAKPAWKRPRIDSDGFAIPDIPIDPALRRSTARRTSLAEDTGEELPELAALLGSSTSESPIDEALTLAVNSAISELEVAQQASSISRHDSAPEGSTLEPVPGEQPKRRQGRPKGAKNWQPPPASAAELALEAAIEGEVREVLESGMMQAVSPTLRSAKLATSSATPPSKSNDAGPPPSGTQVPSSHSDPSSEQETPPSTSLVAPPAATAPVTLQPAELSRASTTAPSVAAPTHSIPNNHPNVEDTSLVYLDDDPEVSSCILSQEEREIKERIWVAENADWLRKDHVKKIKAELQAAADREAGIDPNDVGLGRGKGRGKRRKRGRLGDVSYLDRGDRTRDGQAGVEDGEDGGTARSARDATLKMIAHRGYSRRVNYDVFNSLFPEEDEAARQRSSRSSTSTRAGERRHDSEAGTVASGSRSPAASTPVVERDAAPGAETTSTGASQPSSTTSTPASVNTTSAPSASSIAKPKPKPRPQARKAIHSLGVPISEPGKPSAGGPSESSRDTKPPTSISMSSSGLTKDHGRERKTRRQIRAAADTAMTQEWDEEIDEEEEFLTEAQGEERSWMARAAPKDGPTLASASAAEGTTRGTAIRLSSPAGRSQSLVRQLPTPAVTQPQAQRQVSAQITSPRPSPVAVSIGEEILGSVDDSPLTSLRSSVLGGGDDDEDDEDGGGDADDYVAADEEEEEEDDDDVVEAAFAGRYARRRSFDDDDDDDEDMEDI